MKSYVLISILVMAVVTYLIRMLPLTLMRRRISNRFLKSFLAYVPYAVLTAMTIPFIFYSAASPISAAIGFGVAAVLSFREKGLLTVAVGASAAVFIAERFL